MALAVVPFVAHHAIRPDARVLLGALLAFMCALAAAAVTAAHGGLVAKPIPIDTKQRALEAGTA